MDLIVNILDQKKFLNNSSLVETLLNFFDWLKK